MSFFKVMLVGFISTVPAACFGQFDADSGLANISFESLKITPVETKQDPWFEIANPFENELQNSYAESYSPSLSKREQILFRGQSGGSDGGGAGAGAATDPSVPLAQMQIQNVSISETYDSSGYSNLFIVQPVIPIHLAFELFPYHIIRPTLPVIAPTADPDGALGVEGGLGDLTFIDIAVHPVEQLKTNFGIGYIAIAPTATNPQLGLQEWQVGPSLFTVTKMVPKWNFGALVEVPFSLESDAYSVLMQPIAVRMLPNEWYVGWGDLIWTLDDQNGDYNLPINLRVGKVCKVGNQPLNVFVMPFYTPEELRKGPAADWGVKLSVSFLFPKMQLNSPLFGSR